MGQQLKLIEPVPIDDDLCTGLALIEDVSGLGARFVLYAEQTLYESGDTVCAVKRKIVVPYAAIRPGLQLTAGFLARRTATTVRRLRAVR
jgi:hypothetical protein